MAEPQGFTATPELLTTEFQRANYNDSTNPNSRRDSAYLIRRPNSVGYAVEEEERANPFKNTSIQSVSVTINRQSPTNIAATLSTENQLDGTINILLGRSDGHVILSSLANGITTNLDITTDAAEAGITAAQIRELQRTVSYDGEVDRAEQQQIINLISQAQPLARHQ